MYRTLPSGDSAGLTDGSLIGLPAFRGRPEGRRASGSRYGVSSSFLIHTDVIPNVSPIRRSALYSSLTSTTGSLPPKSLEIPLRVGFRQSQIGGDDQVSEILADPVLREDRLDPQRALCRRRDERTLAREPPEYLDVLPRDRGVEPRPLELLPTRPPGGPRKRRDDVDVLRRVPDEAVTERNTTQAILPSRGRPRTRRPERPPARARR